MEAREVLEKVKNNEISIEEAEKYFKKSRYEEMGYAKLDTHRESGADLRRSFSVRGRRMNIC